MTSIELPFPSDTPAGFTFVGLPPQYQAHPLLNGDPYFTLPGSLLSQVVVSIGVQRFDAELLEMDHALSDVCGDHSSRVGFWLRQPIIFCLLRPDNDLTSDFLVQGLVEWGKTADEAREILTRASQRLDWTNGVRKGYCGWLLTNRTFLDEHSQILQTWEDQVEQSGIPNMGPVVRDADAVPGAERAECDTGQFIRDFEAFFIRWRLDGMPAPFVPQPMGTHLPVVDLRPVLGHMRHGGTTFYLPDTYPVPSRDTLREIVEEALREVSPPDHLAEWFEIVHSDNVAKNRIAHYVRIFEIQHYMRALHIRHASTLQRKKSLLTTVLGEYLHVSGDSIERDLRLIASRLGSDWYLPPA